MFSYRSPELCQFADEELLIQIGKVVFPGAVKRWRTENGFRIWVEVDPRRPTDPAARAEALAIFQTLLGILRSWRSIAGELREEQRGGLGAGSTRDEAGNQWLAIGPAIEYRIQEGEIEELAARARCGIDASQHLRNALWLNGRMNRTAADYYMIHEYAAMEFAGMKGIRDALGISTNAQLKLTRSANSLSPLQGGRHAKGESAAPMSLAQQRIFTMNLLRRWIDTH